MGRRAVERQRSFPAGSRGRGFEAYVAGAGGRLLHTATLLTAEPPGAAPLAEDLLVRALARTYADWGRLRGEDPYDHTRTGLATRFARSGRRFRRPRGGLLGVIPPQERLVLVLRFHEGVAEEQVAAAFGLSLARVRTLGTRAVNTLRSDPAAAKGWRPEAVP